MTKLSEKIDDLKVTFYHNVKEKKTAHLVTNVRGMTPQQVTRDKMTVKNSRQET